MAPPYMVPQTVHVLIHFRVKPGDKEESFSPFLKLVTFSDVLAQA